MYLIVFFVLVPVFIFSQNRISTGEYINLYKKLAIKEMKRVGVPASITLAQGILESDAGNSRLATKANNHFGIKCHNNWNGKRIYHDDDAKGECFRKYKSSYDSYRDHSDFLKRYKRYDFLFNYKTTDYKNWSKGLKKAGYATDRHYANDLIRIIEKYKLYTYDSKRKAKIDNEIKDDDIDDFSEPVDFDNITINPYKNQIQQENNINCIIAEKGQTAYAIAREQDMMVWQIKKYNDLNEEMNIKEGQYIYLQPKKNKAEIGIKYHKVALGESMYDISQKYGIKLKKLYKKNLLEIGKQPEVGQKIYLRKKKKGN